MYISLSYDKEKKWENIYYFVRANEFKYTKNQVSLVLNENKRQIHLKTTFLARDVYILCDNEDEIAGLS